ncbi:MAG: putative metalloprotease CJM1_0395 family protein [Pseudomonadota bacterium]
MDDSATISVITPAYQAAGLPRREERDAAVEKNAAADKARRPEKISQTERRELEKLQHRDREVKAHELAHKATAGQYAKGAASFDYKIGPDGKRYAVGGEVSIDIGKEADPQKTLEKARVIRRAALAPADPSGQDRRIAAQATIMEAEARQELLIERRESAETSAEEEPSDNNQPQTTPAGRRAIGLFKAVESASMPAREDPFDHFI